MRDLNRLTAIFQILATGIIMIVILDVGRSILLPFFIAVLLSMVLDPVVNLLTRIKIPHSIAVFLTILLTFTLFYLIGLLMYSSAKSFANNFPTYENKIKEILSVIYNSLEKLIGQPLSTNISEVDWFKTIQDFSITQRVISSIGSFLNFLWNIVLVIIFIIYFLFGKSNLFNKVERAFSYERSKRILNIIENVFEQVQVYLGTKTVVSLLTALLSLIVFLIFGLDFAIIWVFLIFVFNYIPNFGSIVASGLPLIIAFLQYESPWTAIWLGIIIIAIQFSVGNILEPRLMGHSLNLSPLMVIISLIFWGWLWGVAGLMLAVPILAMMTIVFENISSLRFVSVFFRGDQKKEFG